MIINPVRLFRRLKRLRAAVDDEASHLRRLHGEHAARVAAEKLRARDLTRWGRLVMEGALRQLRRERPSLELTTLLRVSRQS
jgi:hypothetical protein